MGSRETRTTLKLHHGMWSEAEVDIGVDLTDLLFDVSGYKRTAAQVGKVLATRLSAPAKADLEETSEYWSGSARPTVRDFTIVRGGS